MNEQDKLEKKFFEELREEFYKNNMKGADVYGSMLMAVATVLANVYRELWREIDND